jgi:hypothetical protein
MLGSRTQIKAKADLMLRRECRLHCREQWRPVAGQQRALDWCGKL